MSRLSVGAPPVHRTCFLLLLAGVLWPNLTYATKRYVRQTVRYRSVPSVTFARSFANPKLGSSSGSILSLQNALDARTISIWISPRAPSGVSQQLWRESIRAACAAWFEPAGCIVQVVRDRTSAEVLFNVADLSSNIMGESRIPSALVFPRVPRQSQKVRVFVNRKILSLGHRNLLRTLKHEVGHVIGLPHDSRSVVGRHYADLTVHDERRIAQFRNHLDRKWPLTR